MATDLVGRGSPNGRKRLAGKFDELQPGIWLDSTLPSRSLDAPRPNTPKFPRYGTRQNRCLLICIYGSGKPSNYGSAVAAPNQTMDDSTPNSLRDVSGRSGASPHQSVICHLSFV